jgi:hypothetical protein
VLSPPDIHQIPVETGEKQATYITLIESWVCLKIISDGLLRGGPLHDKKDRYQPDVIAVKVNRVAVRRYNK